MKKNIFYWAAAGCVALSLSLSSCSDSMVEEKLYSQIGSSNLSDEEGAVFLNNGVYGYVQYFSYYGGNNLPFTVSANSDDFYCNWGSLDPTSWGGAQNFLNQDPGHSQVNQNYEEIFKLITQANEVINTYGDKVGDSDIIEQAVAESRFWRAFSYDKLYRLYGTVPLLTGNEDVSNGLARAEASVLESFIETELKAAEAALPTSYSASDWGRPTTWAAKAALSRFYLNQKNWSQASAYAKDIIDNGGFELQDNYQDVFGNNGNSEVILAVNHIEESQQGNKYVALELEAALKNALGIEGVGASNGYGMSTPFYKSFAPADARIEPYNPITKTGIAITGVITGADGVAIYSGAKVEDQLNRVVTFKWPLRENIPNGEDAGLDFPLYRLAETYLTYAEAEAQLNHLDVAMTYINKVHTRANLDALPEYASKSEVMTALINERGWECYHELFRREDLVRNDLLLEKVNEKYQYYHNGEDMAWKNDANRRLLPIPNSQLVLNPKLTQNPGY